MKKFNLKSIFKRSDENEPEVVYLETGEVRYKKLSPLYIVFVLILTSFLRAVAMNMFILPNKIAPGGITGISSILYNALGWNASLSSLVMNIPLVILAFIYINKSFGVLTAIAIAATSGFMEILTLVNFPVFADDAFAAAIMGGILNGVSLSLLLRINASSGGSDIIALLVQNKAPQVKAVWLMFVLNAAVALAAAIAFKSMTVMIYSLVSIYVGSYIAEMLQKGFISTVEFKIITSKKEEISKYVIENLHHGVSLMEAKGMYTGQDVDYLVCVVRKRQEHMLARYIKEVDPEAFYYIATVRTVIGKGFNNDITPKSKIK